ncbi:MAG: hypothetical protein U0872_03750 [Planctomycetaceae bacterium]
MAEFPGGLSRIEWWGDSNGLAPEINFLLSADKEKSPSEKINGLSAWQKAWREDQDLRFLTEVNGVVLEQPLVIKPNGWQPGQFLLSPTSAAAKWSDDGGPIGADLRQLEPLGPLEKKDAGKPVKKRVTPRDF